MTLYLNEILKGSLSLNLSFAISLKSYLFISIYLCIRRTGRYSISIRAHNALSSDSTTLLNAVSVMEHLHVRKLAYLLRGRIRRQFQFK